MVNIPKNPQLKTCEVQQENNSEKHLVNLKPPLDAENISKKIASAIGAIKCIRHLMPFNILINVYHGLVQPHFDRCNEVWRNCNKGLSDKLQKLQNRAARILMSAGNDSNLDDLLRALGWRKLCHQNLDKKSIMMYKTLNGMTPQYLRSSFVFRDNLNSYH